MKKIIILLSITISITVFTPSSAYTQQKHMETGNPVSLHTRFGIMAGPHLNWLDYYDKSTTIEGTNAGFHAGIFFQKNISKCLALQPALLFSLRGGKISDIDSTINARLMNIEIPIHFLCLYKQLMIGAGPNFSYGIHGRLKSNSHERNAYDAGQSFERTLKRFELGVNFMIGYTFKKDVFITAFYSAGLTNIYKGDGSAPHDVKATTKMLGVSLGYIFDPGNNHKP